MKRILAAAFLFAATAFGLAATAAADPLGPVQKSGKTYHAAVCPGPAASKAARCNAHVVTDAKGNPIAHRASPSATPGGLNPASLRAAYGLSATWASGVPAGPVIAIVDAYGYNKAEADLAVYRSQFGLPACTTANGCFRKLNQLGVAGNYPRQNTGWAQESALDLDMASAACPTCRLVLVEASSASYDNLAQAVRTAAALPGVIAVSNSYGGSETGSQSYEASYDHPGIAVTVSTGDSGYGVQFPASSPHVTAVGGTSLSRSATTRGWSETAWSGAGSGCSAVYAKPAWQTDNLCFNRTVADVSAVADPNTGVAVYGPVTSKFSGWLVFGGTSVSAPLIAGIYGSNGGTVNYGSDPYGHASSLYDVTSGSNGSCGGSYLCTAVPGYDGPTGLGTPNGTAAF